jgi:hypothetical protein
MFMTFHLLKSYIRNPSLFFFSFSPSHLQGNDDGNHDPRAHICAWGGEFCQVSIFTKLVCQTGWGHFFVLPKLDGCQVDFPNCWSCCYYVCSMPCLRAIGVGLRAKRKRELFGICCSILIKSEAEITASSYSSYWEPAKNASMHTRSQGTKIGNQ